MVKRNHIAIARKAARIRMRMKQARKEFIENLKTINHPELPDPVAVRRQSRVYARLMPVPNFGTTLDEDCSD